MTVSLDWAAEASCRNSKNDFFSTIVTQEMYDTCYDCPVLQQCREHSLSYELHGFWAAMTPNQRRDERKRLGIQTPPALLFDPMAQSVGKNSRNNPNRVGESIAVRRRNAISSEDIPHGTYKGYRMETNVGMTPCDECREANKIFMREYRKKKKEKVGQQ
jgi:hypothetical protein